MATTVYKETFHLSDIGADDTVTLDLPAWCEILTVAEQFKDSGSMQVWYRCCPDQARVPHRIIVVGTGNPAPNSWKARYISTVILSGGVLVLHFFDGKSP